MNNFLLTEISFNKPELLWLLIPILCVFIYTVFFQKGYLLVSAIRVLTLSILVVAFAEPQRDFSSKTRELSALLDVSYSVSGKARAALLKKLQEYSASDASINLHLFGRQPERTIIPVNPSSSEREISAMVQDLAEKTDTGETNIASGLNASLNHSTSSSVLLLSDGFETLGNALEVARLAAERGMRIYPLLPEESVFNDEELSISSVYAPVTAGAGDIVEVRVSVRNGFAKAGRGRLELWLDKEKLYAQELEIPGKQEKLVVVKTPPTKGGLHRLRAVLHPGDKDTSVEENKSEKHRWISIKEKAKILLLSGSKDDNRIIKQLISYKGFGLEDVIADGNATFPESFKDFSSVVLNNISKQQLPKAYLEELKRFVNDGGGLLLIGGDRSFGLGGYIDTPLEEISPLKFVPPQTEKRRLNNAVVMVIDKSGSMAEEDKIVSARHAALASIESLKEEDYVGVIGFDSVPFVIIDVKKAKDAKFEAERRLRNLTATGKTNLLPALALARQKLERIEAGRKHIIVLSDGQFPQPSEAYVAEINALRAQGVSVSAVALGTSADVPFMKILSKYGNGAFYHTLDAGQLAQIFLQDIRISTGEKTLKENQEFPVGIGPSGVSSVSIQQFPELRGFVETLPKKGAQLELITKKDERIFPILSSWEYGNGRVIAYTSDANARWSLPWAQSADFFAKFWGEIIEQIKSSSVSKTGDVDFDLRYAVNKKSLLLDLAMFDERLSTQSPPKIVAVVETPGGEQRSVLFRQVRKGRFEGRVENARPGDYKINVNYGNLKLPPLAITASGEAFGELPGRGVNIQLLSDLAFVSGGAINPDPGQLRAFERVVKRQETLVPWLLLLAFALILIEAFVRERGKDVLPFSSLVAVPKG